MGSDYLVGRERERDPQPMMFRRMRPLRRLLSENWSLPQILSADIYFQTFPCALRSKKFAETPHIRSRYPKFHCFTILLASSIPQLTRYLAKKKKKNLDKAPRLSTEMPQVVCTLFGSDARSYSSRDYARKLRARLHYFPSRAILFFEQQNSRAVRDTYDAAHVRRHDSILTTKAKQMHFLVWTHPWRPRLARVEISRQFEISRAGNTGYVRGKGDLIYRTKKQKKLVSSRSHERVR